MRAVLYDVDWQVIRINTLADRHALGGWPTLEGTEDNLGVMLDYLSDVDSDEVHTRRYRVHNMLNAVVMGYNGQRASQDLINKVRGFRAYHDTGGYSRSVVQMYADNWNWNYQKHELQELRTKDKDTFDYLRANLKLRANKGTKKTRPELHKFLRLMDLTR